VTNPEHIAALKARLRKIKENPRQALFSEFKGRSRTGAITVWVDMLGRQKRVHIAPNTVREGDEQWPAPSPATAVPRYKRRPQGRPDDDEWFDDFTIQR